MKGAGRHRDERLPSAAVAHRAVPGSRDRRIGARICLCRVAPLDSRIHRGDAVGEGVLGDEPRGGALARAGGLRVAVAAGPAAFGFLGMAGI